MGHGGEIFILDMGEPVQDRRSGARPDPPVRLHARSRSASSSRACVRARSSTKNCWPTTKRPRARRIRSCASRRRAKCRIILLDELLPWLMQHRVPPTRKCGATCAAGCPNIRRRRRRRCRAWRRQRGRPEVRLSVQIADGNKAPPGAFRFSIYFVSGTALAFRTRRFERRTTQASASSFGPLHVGRRPTFAGSCGGGRSISLAVHRELANAA